MTGDDRARRRPARFPASRDASGCTAATDGAARRRLHPAGRLPLRGRADDAAPSGLNARDLRTLDRARGAALTSSRSWRSRAKVAGPAGAQLLLTRRLAGLPAGAASARSCRVVRRRRSGSSSRSSLTAAADMFVDPAARARGRTVPGGTWRGDRALAAPASRRGDGHVVGDRHDPSDVFFPVAFFCIAPGSSAGPAQPHAARPRAGREGRAGRARREPRRSGARSQTSARGSRASCTTCSRTACQRDGGAVGRRAAGRSTREPDRRRAGAGARSSAPAARRWPSCASCSARCAAARTSALLGPAAELAALDELVARPRAAGLSRRAARRGRARGRCRPASTWPRTGSSRRRSPTRSSTPGARTPR